MRSALTQKVNSIEVTNINIHNDLLKRTSGKLKNLGSSKDALSYADFLAVHAILFEEFYPWAGQDRATTLPNSAVKKGEVLFLPITSISVGCGAWAASWSGRSNDVAEAG